MPKRFSDPQERLFLGVLEVIALCDVTPEQVDHARLLHRLENASAFHLRQVLKDYQDLRAQYRDDWENRFCGIIDMMVLPTFVVLGDPDYAKGVDQYCQLEDGEVESGECDDATTWPAGTRFLFKRPS